MYDVEYPDAKLYQEITFVKHFFSGKWVIENVKPYYEPWITPTAEIGRHLFWSNFSIPKFKYESNYIFAGEDKNRVKKLLGYDLSKYKLKDEVKVLRNCVVPEVGKAILDQATGVYLNEMDTQSKLF